MVDANDPSSLSGPQELPKISVIVATFNQGKYIGRCLRSLLSQSAPLHEYEIIVIDDGSFDSTPVVLEAFGPQIRKMVNPINLGLPSSLNRAILSARAPYFIRVDSDDFVNKNFVAVFLAFVSLSVQIHAVSCDYLIVDDEERILSYENSSLNPIACGVLFNRDEVIDIGLYDEEFLRHEDRELRLRFESKFEVMRIPIPLYRYRRHGMNITNNLLLMQFYESKLDKKRARHGD